MTEAVLNTLKERYPYAVQFFETFLPLEELCHTMAKELPAPTLPMPIATAEHIVGKALYPADKDHIDLYTDAAVLSTATRICQEAAKVLPDLAQDLEKLAVFLPENPKAAQHLASLVLLGKQHRIAPWAKKHGMGKDSSGLVGTYLARTAAVRVALHSSHVEAQEAFESGAISEHWNKNTCPVCGHAPNAGYLYHKEGHRYLHCSLCHSTWRFSRTTCPACEDAKPENRTLFTLESGAEQRAEGCKVCQRYMLVPDIRQMADTIPMYALLYCLMPLDILMQDEGYEPLD